MAFNAAASGGRFASLFPGANQDFPRATDFMGSGFNTTTSLPGLPDGQNPSPIFPIPTSAGSTVVDMFANNTISYHYITKCRTKGHKRKNEMSSDELIGRPVFVKRSVDYASGPHHVELMTMETLNDHLLFNADDDEKANVFEHWNFIGIIKNEVMRHANFMQNRMFNVAVGLRASAAAETWEKHTSHQRSIRPMSRLFFIANRKADGITRVEGVVDPDADILGDCVYAGFAHNSPTCNANLSRNWPTESVFEIFVRG